MKRLSRKKASSLVTTLLVIVVLTIIVVAFMQSMSVERLTAKSYANKYQAELLAEAATEDAVNRIFTAIEPRPYSATFYSNNVNGKETRHLFLSRYNIQSNGLVTDRVPLFSTLYTTFSLFTNSLQSPIETATNLVADTTESGAPVNRSLTNSTDLYTEINRTTLSFPSGYVGLTNASGVMSLPANWIYQTNAQGKVVGRYAYWVDDETSKIDLRTAGMTNRGIGTNLNEITLGAFVPLGVTSNQVTNLVNYKNQDFTGKSPAISRFALGTGTAITNNALWSAIRPYLTQYSLHDLRSPDGVLALNLNSFVSSTTNATNIQQQVETIATAITNNLPSFGERFFQASGDVPTAATPSALNPAPSSPLTYVKKIAANIRDYLDSDNTATVIMEDGSAYTGVAPDFIPYDAIIDDIPIVGKERGPYLNELYLVTRVISPNPEPASGDVSITVRFGHYVELYNPTSKDITYSELGPNPRVIIANQTNWLNQKDSSIIRPADVRLDLPSNIVIPAQGYVVLTTDGPPWNTSSQMDYKVGPAGRYTLLKGTGPGTWSLLGTAGQTTPTGTQHEDYVINTATLSSNRYTVKTNALSNSYDGCRERILFVNDQGIIDYSLRTFTVGDIYMGRLVRNPTCFSTFPADGNTSSNNTNPESVASRARLSRGDPRANTEISEISANTSASWKSGASPYYGDTGMSPNQATLGANNYNWSVSIGTANMWRDGWAEYSAVGNNYIANTNMTSVGELGFIYDPARYNISWYRTYGRTLRVGQPDTATNNRNNNSAVANDRNWIGGLGTNGVTSTNYLKNAFLLANVFRTDDDDYGKINPNGLFRGNGRVVLDTLFRGFTFSSPGTFQVSGQLTARSFNSNAVYNAMNAELRDARPFIGVGDISRLDTFGNNSLTTGVASNVSMIDFAVSDGDREEVFRRTAGLLSTQSLSYSVYVVGQSGRFVRNPMTGDYVFKISSTSRKNTIVQFQPTYSSTNFPAIPSSWKILKPWQINLN